MIAIVAFVLLLVAVALPHFRYTAVRGKGEVVYLVDNFTGKTRGIRGSRMFNVVSAETKQRKTRKLTKSEVENITGRMGPSSYGSFSGDLYNANAHTAISSVNLAITTTIAGVRSHKIYTAEVEIPPLNAKYCSVTIIKGDVGAAHEWYIASATGYDVTD